MKYIHAGIFGPPKSFKTGAVTSTYPGPIGGMMFDSGGLEILDSVRPKRTWELLSDKDFRIALLNPQHKWKDVTCIDYSFRPDGKLESTYAPVSEASIFENTVQMINFLHEHRAKLPFKTWIVDPVTELGAAIWRHQAALNKAALADPRKWASNIGLKVGQVIDHINALPMNTVFIFHSEVEKDELTQKTRTIPMVHSRLREQVGGKFSQFFYQEIYNGKPMLRVLSSGTVEGIGSRWPSFEGKDRVDPGFNSVFGTEPEVFK